MDINDLTLRQIKEIKALTSDEVSPILNRHVGKYVIVRSYNEGINAGVVVMADETGIVLKDARRLWSNRALDKKLSWYEGVAVSGLAENNKVAGAVAEKVIIEKYSTTLCSEKAEKSIREFKTNEQS